MPKYIIERELPGLGNLSEAELRAVSQKSCSVIADLNSAIQWIESFVTNDKLYCIYLSPNKELILEHARMGEFPANRIEEVLTMISPLTAEEAA